MEVSGPVQACTGIALPFTSSTRSHSISFTQCVWAHPFIYRCISGLSRWLYLNSTKLGTCSTSTVNPRSVWWELTLYLTVKWLKVKCKYKHKARLPRHIFDRHLLLVRICHVGNIRFPQRLVMRTANLKWLLQTQIDWRINKSFYND